MSVFAYEAIDPQTNKLLQGTLEAENLREAKEILRSQGAIPTRLEQTQTAITVEQVLAQTPVIGDLMAGQIGLRDLALMTEQLHTLLDAGIPLIEALHLLSQQTTNKKLQGLLGAIRADIIAGESLSSALAKYPKYFDSLYINMIRSGEVSGNLDMICKRLAGLLEKTIELQGKLQSAMIYPAVTILVVIGVVVVIMLVVVPQFQTFFGDSPLPLPTQILIQTSKFFQNFWWGLLLGSTVLILWFNNFRLGVGKPLTDQWMLTMPIIGDVLRKLYVSRFIRTLGTVVGSGVSLTEGLLTAAGTVDNYVLRAAFDKARESLIMGGTLSKPLEKTGAFPVMVVKMIAIAEETGQIEDMLNKSADFLDVEVDRSIETMTTLIEPIMIVVLGGIILGVALALYIPLFDLSNHVK